MADFLPQRPGFDFHALLDTGHAVDEVGMRPGNIDNHRGSDLRSIFQFDPGCAAVLFQNARDFGVEKKLTALSFGGHLDVVR